MFFVQTANGTWGSFLLPSVNNCDWFTFSCKGCSITFDVPTIKGSNLKSMMLLVVYYSSTDNIVPEGCQGMLIINHTKTTIHVYERDTLTSFGHEDWHTITSNFEPGNKVEVMVVFGEGFIVEKTTLSLLYDQPLNKEMERCHVVNEDVICSGNDDNNASVSGGDNEVNNHYGEGTMNHMYITRHSGGWDADVSHDSDQPEEAVAEEIHAAEVECDQEQQVPPPEGQPEQQAAIVAPKGIGPALTQILDALSELKADFVRLEHTVTARWNAVEVRLEKIEDAITQIPRVSSSD